MSGPVRRLTAANGVPLAKGVGLIGAGLLIGLAGVGVVDALRRDALIVEGHVDTGEMNIEFTQAFTNDDGAIDDLAMDPDDGDGGVDPGYDKAVAECLVAIEVQGDAVNLIISHGYPSYTCQFWVEMTNVGALALRRGPPVISSPDVLTVSEPEAKSCAVLSPGEQEIESFRVHVEQQAAQNSSYSFTVEKKFLETVQGTPGFWKNWDSHKTFTEEEIELRLIEIDATSAWFTGLDTVEEMEAIFDAAQGKGATAEKRFLAQYLALRLNALSSLLCGTEPHDVTAQDPGNYLGLANPTAATLGEIIDAIESKFSSLPTPAQFNIMKDVCDALNNQAI